MRVRGKVCFVVAPVNERSMKLNASAEFTLSKAAFIVLSWPTVVFE